MQATRQAEMRLGTPAATWRQQRERRLVRRVHLARRLLLVLALVAGGLAASAAWQWWTVIRWNARLDELMAGPAATAEEGAQPASGASTAGRSLAIPSRSSDTTQTTGSAAAGPGASAAASEASAAGAGTPAWLSDGSPPVWRYAQGVRLAEAGDVDAALARWRSVHDDPLVGLRARYNGANLLLREALRLEQGATPGQALVLMELAKEGYRAVLRRDPGFGPARYNLEQLMARQPEAEAVTGEPPAPAERAATTMRSISRGLP
ncbi:MAG: hypothetical protein RL722_98 [Pseudomonadota bacterium]|jgi:mxaK protein